MNSTRILIVGGGIGGLTLAAALSRRGLDCDLIERTAAWAPVGAGITLGVNATGILDRIGLLEQAKACSRVIARASITDAAGRSLSDADFGEAFRGLGVSLAIHRADLHAVLVSGCDRAAIRMGTTLGSVEQEAGGHGPVRVTFSDGSAGEYDLVVGADGIRSQTRDLAFGPVASRYSGYACWRFMVRARIDPPSMYEMWGRGKRVGVVPLTGDAVYAFATINTPPANAAYASIGAPDFVRLFAEFGGPARAVFDAVTAETRLIYGDLEEIRLPHWVRGRVVLLGDAAHAMTPNLGQGAAMAMEDSMALAEAIAGVAEGTSDFGAALGNAFDRWYRRRRPRAEGIQNTSWRQGKIAQSANPVACGLRDLAVRLTPDRVAIQGVKRLLLAEW